MLAAHASGLTRNAVRTADPARSLEKAALFVAETPRNPSGKILQRVLRESCGGRVRASEQR